MSTMIVVSILVPIGIMFINFGVGLSLRLSDFKQIKHFTKPIAVNMFFQIVGLPLMTWALISLFNLSTSLAIGMFLLAASPGGTFATFYSHMAKGNTGLNVTLTALHSVYGVFAIPIAAFLTYKLYYGMEKTVPLDFFMMVQVIVALIVPVAIGVFVNEKWPAWTQKNIKKIGQIGLIAIVLLLVGGFINDFHKIIEAFVKVGLPVIAFNIGCILMGYYGAKLFIPERSQQISLTMELGLHNCSIIIPLAISPYLLNDIEVGMPSAVFIFTGHIIAYTTAYIFNRSAKAK